MIEIHLIDKNIITLSENNTLWRDKSVYTVMNNTNGITEYEIPITSILFVKNL